MKKLTLAVIVAASGMIVTSCGNSTPKADLKNDVDTVSYAIGMAQSQGVKEYLVGALGVDTAYMDEFYKGVIQGANAGDDKKRAAFYAGIQIGQQISNQMVKGINHELFGEDSTKTISLKNLMAGFITGASGKKGLMTADQAQIVAQMKMQAIRAEALAKQYGPNKRAGEKFIAKYAKGKDVKQLPGGIYYKVIKEGTGEMPKDTSMVRVYYELRDVTGKVIESTIKQKEPTRMRANQVISGWTTVLTHMPVGSVWEVVIPQDKAYGERQTGDIKPFSTLLFKIELVGVGEEKK